MISLRNYLKLDGSALRELLLRTVLPRDVRGLVSVTDLPHTPFALNDHPELFDPDRNEPFQRGRIEGFIAEDVVGWPSSSILRTRAGQGVLESYYGPEYVDLARRQKHLVRFPMRRAQVATSIGHMYRNYFHKHIDSIPRLYGLHHPALRAFDRIDLYLDPRYSEEELAIIRALIPDHVQIQRVDYSTRLEAERYIFLPFLSQDRTNWSQFFKNCAGYLPTEYLDFYRARIHALWALPEVPEGRRIYVSRRRASIRRIRNEEALMRVLAPLGFELVELERMSIQEQARLFASASVVVAQHGASLTNLLYAHPSLRVLEIFSGKKLKIYETLAKARGMPYFYLTARTGNKNADIELSLSEVETAMDDLLSSSPTTSS